jgi:aminodeoxyfutalosine synthase
MKQLISYIANTQLKDIAEKIIAGIRITPEEGVVLYESTELSVLSILAVAVKKRLSGDKVFFNHNFHIEPTNKCIYNCLFCSYHKSENDPESWEYSHDEIIEIVKKYDDEPVTEVHIVGGVHPDYDIWYWGLLIEKIKKHRPEIHIKAFSAIEIDYMTKKAGLTIEEGLKILKDFGLNSIPGGGAEIFDKKLRRKICNEKPTAEQWLFVHETAHKIGIKSNATMLYGHLETYAHRIAHLECLRKLQDQTTGFNSFIPLKFRQANNKMSNLGEVSIIEDLKNYAVSRLFLDNFPHIKAYWPMIGKETAQLALLFGVDDLDGTIDDTTKIYSMAGADEKKPSMTTKQLSNLISQAGYKPVERDSNYNIIMEVVV